MDDAARNRNDGSEGAAIEREAILWLVRLEEDEGDGSLQDQFEAWIAADPRHAGAWRETFRMADIVARAGGPPGAVDDRGGFARRKRAWSLRRGWRSWGTIATGVAALSIVAVASPDIALQLYANEATRTAEIRTFHLADGTMVTLGPMSAISVAMRDRRRDVRLLRGEAYFDVVHDVTRPFQVTAGQSATRVLGTAFEVRLADDRVAVAVSRGAVEVSLPGRAEPLGAALPQGQALSLDWQGHAKRGSIQPDRIAVWRDGRLIVDDRPVAEVIAALRPWSKSYIIVRGAGADTRRVTGVYDLRSPDAALNAIAKALDIEVRHVTPWLRVVTVR